MKPTHEQDLVPPKPAAAAEPPRGLWQRLLAWYLGWLGSIFRPPR
jgi:hypothetical protein